MRGGEKGGGRVWHAAERSRQRGIIARDIKCAVMNGEIIESYPDDFPFPSCLILGRTPDNVPIHVCMSDEGTSGRILSRHIFHRRRNGEPVSEQERRAAENEMSKLWSRRID